MDAGEDVAGIMSVQNGQAKALIAAGIAETG
jgi:hypothetical protein